MPPVSTSPCHPGQFGGRADFSLAFYVDGTTIPDVDWDVGPSWAGLLPISGDALETRKVSLFFFFCFLDVNAELAS